MSFVMPFSSSGGVLTHREDTPLLRSPMDVWSRVPMVYALPKRPDSVAVRGYR